MLLGIKPEYVEIKTEENTSVIENVIIGIYNKKLSKKNKYNALIGLDIIERSDESEYITSISK